MNRKGCGLGLVVILVIAGIAAVPGSATAQVWKTHEVYAKGGETKFKDFSVNDTSDSYPIMVVNGDPEGKRRIASAKVIIENSSGSHIVYDQSDFNHKGLKSSKSASYRTYSTAMGDGVIVKGSNRLIVQANGNADAHITVSISVPGGISNNSYGFGDCDGDGANSYYQYPRGPDSPNMYYGSFRNSPWQSCEFIVIR
ncbi:MAG: hypothetical protein JSV26_07450 [bacterium]|nr:MAG: hypothetical protein JSV26_07450 [bacterium]